jgi:hypothetical protein
MPDGLTEEQLQIVQRYAVDGEALRILYTVWPVIKTIIQRVGRAEINSIIAATIINHVRDYNPQYEFSTFIIPRIKGDIIRHIQKHQNRKESQHDFDATRTPETSKLPEDDSRELGEAIIGMIPDAAERAMFAKRFGIGTDRVDPKAICSFFGITPKKLDEICNRIIVENMPRLQKLFESIV